MGLFFKFIEKKPAYPDLRNLSSGRVGLDIAHIGTTFFKFMIKFKNQKSDYFDKSQLISKYPFGAVFTIKIPTNFFKDFCPSL